MCARCWILSLDMFLLPVILDSATMFPICALNDVYIHTESEQSIGFLSVLLYCDKTKDAFCTCSPVLLGTSLPMNVSRP